MVSYLKYALLMFRGVRRNSLDLQHEVNDRLMTLKVVWLTLYWVNNMKYGKQGHRARLLENLLTEYVFIMIL